MKNRLRQIHDVKLVTAAKAIRAAWLDEKLDAEARGDTQRATNAATLIGECDRKIEALRNVRGGMLTRLGTHVTSLLH